ncbi:MAG: choice-of-anchor L domain-containing protein, partial [Flavobacteriales bacterium]
MKSHNTIAKFLFLLGLLSNVYSGTAQFNVVSNGNATDLANAILGSGVTISNVSLNCGELATGVFTGGNAASIGIDQGILLTSGSSLDAIGPNDSGNTSYDQPSAFDNDTDLQALVNGSIQDACVLEFDFVATSNFISVQYVFGSEEYNEFVCSVFDDVFGFFVTGPNPAGGTYNSQNLALVPGTSLPVSVNTINNGVTGSAGSISGCVSLDYASLYNDNASSLQMEYDGFTIVLTAEVAVIPGQTYHFKFAIADASDSILDSGVFIRSESFSIFNCQAGNVIFAPESPQQFCTADTIADILHVATNSTASTDEYTFILTNTAGDILAVDSSGIFDLSGYSTGYYQVYGISYQGIPSGIEVGQNVSGIMASEDGCIDLTLPFSVLVETCIPFTLSCPSDVEVECGDDLTDFDIVGYPVISFDFDLGQPVSVVYTDVVISSNDCVTVISRTWTASFNGESLSCTQIITIRDTEGPVMNGFQPTIEVQCQEDRPDFAMVTANDVCSGEESVTMWQS